MELSDFSDSESSTGSSGYTIAPSRFRCTDCSRSFHSGQALHDHQTDSNQVSDMARTFINFVRNPLPAPPTLPPPPPPLLTLPPPPPPPPSLLTLPPPPPPPSLPMPPYEHVMRLAPPSFVLNNTVGNELCHPVGLHQPPHGNGFQRHHPYLRQRNPAPVVRDDHDLSGRTRDLLSLMDPTHAARPGSNPQRRSASARARGYRANGAVAAPAVSTRREALDLELKL